MRKAFIVMAYKDPGQIERLVRRMDHPDFHFYIHVDRKIDIQPFLYLEQFGNVFFTRKRYEIIWASYRFTEAVIRIMEEVLNSGEKYDFVSSFSGQDYPIKSNEHIRNYYEGNKGRSFLSLEDQSSEWWPEAYHRFRNYHMTNYKFRGRYLLQRLINAILPDRKFPIFEHMYGGPRATWWTLSSECGDYVVEFMKKNPALARFCRYTWAPDEFLIPTIVMNSPYKDKVVPDSGRYIDWSAGGANPKILVSEDLKSLLVSEKLFARKFDVRVDTNVLDALDRELSGR